MKTFHKLPDETVWPAPEAVGDLEWQLRYGNLTRAQQLQAASVVAAYNAIMTCTGKRRAEVVRWLRECGHCRCKGPT